MKENNLSKLKEELKAEIKEEMLKEISTEFLLDLFFEKQNEINVTISGVWEDGGENVLSVYDVDFDNKTIELVVSPRQS